MRICDECQFFVNTTGPMKQGECRRYPPTLHAFPIQARIVGAQATPDFMKFTAFPIVNHNCPECGEFKPKIHDA